MTDFVDGRILQKITKKLDKIITRIYLLYKQKPVNLYILDKCQFGGRKNFHKLSIQMTKKSMLSHEKVQYNRTCRTVEDSGRAYALFPSR